MGRLAGRGEFSIAGNTQPTVRDQRDESVPPGRDDHVVRQMFSTILGRHELAGPGSPTFTADRSRVRLLIGGSRPREIIAVIVGSPTTRST